MNISKKELSSVVDSWRDFHKKFDKASKCLQIPLPTPRIENETTKAKDNLLARYYSDVLEHPNRQIRLSFRFENNIFCVLETQ